MQAQDTAKSAESPKRRGRRGTGSVKLIRKDTPDAIWRAAFTPAAGHKKVYLFSKLVRLGGTQKQAEAKMISWQDAFRAAGQVCSADRGCPRCADRQPTPSQAGHAHRFTTLDDWGRYWLEFEIKPGTDHERTVDVTTYDGYAWGMAKHVLPRLGSQPLATLRTDHIEAWWNQMTEEGVGPGSRRYAKKVLGTCLEAALAKRDKTGLQFNAAHAYKLARVRKGDKKPKPKPDPAVRAAITDAARNSAQSEPFGLVVDLGFDLALRRQEIAGLQFGDFDFSRNLVKIRRRVNRVTGLGIVVRGGVKMDGEFSFREVPFNPAVWGPRLHAHRQQLVEYWRKHAQHWAGADPHLPTAYLFPSRTGEAPDPHDIGKWFKKMARSAGAADHHLHQMRHDAISAKILSGADMEKVAKFAGHANSGITESIYFHSDVEYVRDIVDVDQHFWAADGATR